MISLAICTYNRANLLPKAIKSILSSIEEDWFIELLVIDNNSSDDTQSIVKELQIRYPKIKYTKEKKQGISWARNRAIAEASGEFLVFLDDDAWAAPKWLENLISPLQVEETLPKCIVGPVKLIWEGGKPPWFPQQFESLLCEYNFGEESHYLGKEGYLLTTNVLFHLPTIRKLGGFRQDLGRLGNKTLGGEDNEIYRRLFDNGYRIWYQADATVFHPVPKERQTRQYLLERLYWDGASQPLLDGIVNKKKLGRQILYECRKLCLLYCYHLLAKGEKKYAISLEIQQRLGRLATKKAIILGKLTPLNL